MERKTHLLFQIFLIRACIDIIFYIKSKSSGIEDIVISFI